MASVPHDFEIDAPELLTRRQRARDTVVTAAMWVFYMYLWLPLLSLFAWLLGFEFAYSVMVTAGGATRLKAVLADYSMVVALILAVVMMWSISNRVRFKNKNRRKGSRPVNEREISEHFGIPVRDVYALRSWHIIRVTIDEQGRPTPILEEGRVYQRHRPVAQPAERSTFARVGG
jgi:biofilm PGA synthesis protein PgaD